ncbi:MAG: heme-binding protein [Pseudomonadota bacterium]
MNGLAMLGVGIVAISALAGGLWLWSSRSIEMPDYTVELKDGAFELRRYPAMVVASIDRAGSRGNAVRAAFSPLAGYIFARSREGEKIAMTAPVTQEPATDGWKVSFIMPSGRSVVDLPQPTAEIELSNVAPRLAASITFSGSWMDSRFEEASDKLLIWVERQGYLPAGPPEYAYYNDPFTPPFLRRNEVIVELNED